MNLIGYCGDKIPVEWVNQGCSDIIMVVALHKLLPVHLSACHFNIDFICGVIIITMEYKIKKKASMPLLCGITLI